MKTPFIIAVFLVLALNVVDFGLTDMALGSGRYTELNPVARLYLKSPAISIPVVSIGNYAVGSALINLHGKSKPWAWVAAGLLIIGHGYVVYHNIRIMK